MVSVYTILTSTTLESNMSQAHYRGVPLTTADSTDSLITSQ